MSDSESLFVSNSSDSPESCSSSDDDSLFEDEDEGKRVHDDFVDAMAIHWGAVRMDLDKWTTEIITIILNNAKEQEWPVGQLKSCINTAAKKHAQMRGHTRNNQLRLESVDTQTGTDGNTDNLDAYELVFSSKELKACANILTNVSFEGSRLKRSHDRLYSLMRHKVLGKSPLKLKAAIIERQRERDRMRKKEEKREKIKKAAANRALEAATTQLHGTDATSESRNRHRECSDNDVDSLDGVEILRDEEIQAALGDNHLDSDIEMDNDTPSTALRQPSTSIAQKVKLPVCFRAQTSHDRLKMQQAVSKDDRIIQLKEDLEGAQQIIQKLKVRVATHKRARATAEIARRDTEKREAIALRELQDKTIILANREAELRKKERALRHDREVLSELNSKVQKDFWGG